MPVLLLPDFVIDLQKRRDAHFARRVLAHTISGDGTFLEDGDDHRYRGINHAWIRYVSRGTQAYRVIFIRSGADVYLYRAGDHSVEDHLQAPKSSAFSSAVPIAAPAVASDDQPSEIVVRKVGRRHIPDGRFFRNNPKPDILRAMLARRNLPHRDIWLVAPYVRSELMSPTARLGRLLLDQVDDGASVTLITRAPKDQDIEWLERLSERDVGVYFFPRLHSKLYCFVLDDDRKQERGLPDPEKLSSLLLLGSANLTKAGLAFDDTNGNEELCYAVPNSQIDYLETYVTTLMTQGYDLKEIRAYRARGQWQRLEEDKW